MANHGRIYSAYRKTRFLLRRGTLFSMGTNNNRDTSIIPASQLRVIAGNSLAFYLLAYLVIYTLNLFVTGFAAMASDIPSIVHYTGVDFIIRGKDWTVDSINIVFSSGPLLMFILSIILLVLYNLVASETGILRMLLLWMMLHAMTRCLGELLVGSMLSQGFGYVILYLFIMDTGKLILTIGTFVVMFSVGLFMTRLTLFSSNIYFNHIFRKDHRRFLTYQVILPFFAGNAVIFLTKMPSMNLFDIGLNASMILFLLPMLVWSSSIEDLYFDEDERKTRLSMVTIAITIALFTIAIAGLGLGVRLSVG